MTLTSLHPHVWVHQSPYYRTNVGVLTDGEIAAVVDPGITPAELDTIKRFTHTRQLRVETVLLTHAHWDHLLGAEYFPEAQIITHAAFADELKQHSPDTQRLIVAFDKENHISRKRRVTLPCPDLTFSTSVDVQIGSLRAQLLHAPGHSADQFVIHLQDSGVLWAADMLSDVEIPYTSQNTAQYHTTLQRLKTLNVSLLIPGHGNPTTSEEEIHGRFWEDLAYLQELRERTAEAARLGFGVEETVSRCRAMRIRNPEINSLYHDWNVESTWLEAGGRANGTVLGWAKEWAGTPANS